MKGFENKQWINIKNLIYWITRRTVKVWWIDVKVKTTGLEAESTRDLIISTKLKVMNSNVTCAYKAWENEDKNW